MDPPKKPGRRIGAWGRQHAGGVGGGVGGKKINGGGINLPVDKTEKGETAV